MADEKSVAEEKKGPRETTDEENLEKTDGKVRRNRVAHWIIVAVVVVVCSGGGFALGRLFAPAHTSGAEETNQEDKLVQTVDLNVDDSATDSKKVWYYNLEPVVACLDEPGITRYVRATLTLAIDSQMDKKKAVALIEDKKPLLINWLTIYLASLSLEDVRGDENLMRIQSQILDAFNEIVFPDTKPQIRRILFKEFPIQ